MTNLDEPLAGVQHEVVVVQIEDGCDVVRLPRLGAPADRVDRIHGAIVAPDARAVPGRVLRVRFPGT